MSYLSDVHMLIKISTFFEEKYMWNHNFKKVAAFCID